VNRVQCMQEGCDWSATFILKGGTPLLPLDISSWILSGAVYLSELPSNSITLNTSSGPPYLAIQNYTIQEQDLSVDNTLIVGQNVFILKVSLSATDTETLGQGLVKFDIVRTTPTPVRPVLQFTITCKPGLPSANT